MCVCVCVCVWCLPYSSLCVCLPFVCVHRWRGTHCHAPSALPLWQAVCTCVCEYYEGVWVFVCEVLCVPLRPPEPGLWENKCTSVVQCVPWECTGARGRTQYLCLVDKVCLFVNVRVAPGVNSGFLLQIKIIKLMWKYCSLTFKNCTIWGFSTGAVKCFTHTHVFQIALYSLPSLAVTKLTFWLYIWRLLRCLFSVWAASLSTIVLELPNSLLLLLHLCPSLRLCLCWQGRVGVCLGSLKRDWEVPWIDYGDGNACSPRGCVSLHGVQRRPMEGPWWDAGDRSLWSSSWGWERVAVSPSLSSHSLSYCLLE